MKLEKIMMQGKGRKGGIMTKMLFGGAVALLLASLSQAGVVKTIDVGLAWSATRTGHQSVDMYGDQQAVSYFDENHHVKVSQRNVNGEHWMHFVTGIKGSLFDGGGHMMTAVAIDKAGYTHVMGAMHAKPLKYWRSTAPVKVRPDNSNPKDLLKMQKVKAMVPKKDGRISYPMFFKDAADDLYLIYRDGSAGSGRTLINKYDANEKKWKRITTLFTKPGSVYSTKPVLGPDGYLHMIFMVRATPDGWDSSMLSYMKSKDMVTWFNAAGEGVSLPITSKSKDAVVDPSPKRGGLINVAYEMGFDSLGRPMAVYNKFVDNDRKKGSGLHIARFEDGEWKLRVIDQAPDRVEMGWFRPTQPLSTDQGEVYINCFYKQDRGATYILNEKDLSLKKKLTPSANFWPDSVYEREITPTPSARKMTVEMRPKKSLRGYSTGNPKTGYFLRWEYDARNMPKRKADPKPWPKAGMLRLYEVDRRLVLEGKEKK